MQDISKCKSEKTLSIHNDRQMQHTQTRSAKIDSDRTGDRDSSHIVAAG